MAHSDRHLFAHLPFFPGHVRARFAITATEVPALHFRGYLGGCLVRGKEAKGRDKSNMKVQFKKSWHREADFGSGGVCRGSSKEEAI